MTIIFLQTRSNLQHGYVGCNCGNLRSDPPHDFEYDENDDIEDVDYEEDEEEDKKYN